VFSADIKSAASGSLPEINFIVIVRRMKVNMQLSVNMAFYRQRLSTGWTFRDRDDGNSDAWMPVPAIPSTVQQDLIANNKSAP
jgi:hypothetical protein